MRADVIRVLALVALALGMGCQTAPPPETGCFENPLHLGPTKMNPARLAHEIGVPPGAPEDPPRALYPGLKAQGTSYQGQTHQGRGLQGRTWQGTSAQGRTDQGKTAQGKTNQGREVQGRAGQGADSVPVALSDLNGGAFSVVGRPVEFSAGVLSQAGQPLGAGTALDVTVPSGQVQHLLIAQVVEREGLTFYGLMSAGQPICGDDQLGTFLAGAWQEGPGHVDRPGVLTYACESGVLTKCTRWGYRPWTLGQAAHDACTRMARADYCGDGVSWTRDGTLVNLYDTLGVQISDPVPEMYFEAGWGPRGAICVNDARYAARLPDGARLLPPCWAELPRCTSLTDASRLGATLANDSLHAEIRVCD